MSLHRLGTRLTRLEDDARRVLWVANGQGSFVWLMAEASTEMGLAPSSIQELCVVCEQTLHALSPSVPACVPDLQAIEDYADRVVEAVVAMLATHIPDPNTRTQLRQALSQACYAAGRPSTVEDVRYER